MAGLVPPEWKTYVNMGVAGLFGGLVAIPSITIQAWEQRLFYVITGVISAIYLSPVMTEHFGIGTSASGFLCGTFAGSVIAKSIELIKTIRLQDIILAILRRGK
ncbi:hypothetical protein PT277_01605 [Acetobacteraceae bacterium ESL0709]|nr:hypothetical protein [Acetobacteraceae bacterium ESL0697]MDF7677397.1 hypothetical protein [Acetobacteraceae bacterium ESL0709]